MPPSTGVGDVPAVLQLQRWSQWPLPIPPSQISEASISPTRRLLLLLSHSSEAHLLPLSLGNRPKFSAESLNEPDTSRVDTISNVKSFSWGHCGDAYSHFREPGFRELLVVAAETRIIVHGFRDCRGEVAEPENVRLGEDVAGEWVEWGPRNPFRTYFTKLDTFVSSGGKFSSRFPATSSIPLSTDVVSFDVYDSTKGFLEFEKKRVVPLCLRVFSSSSHSLIGLVLTFPENSSIEENDGHERYEGKCLVVVIKLYQWGMQWVCSVDLHDRYLGQGPSHEWADFQFSEEFLICLSTSGMISIWDANSGSFVASFDVMRISELHPKITCTEGEAEQEGEVRGSEMGGKDLAHSRIFRRLMVVSHSFLWSVLDEYGIVYVIWAADYISENHMTFDKFIHPSQLSGWKAAGSEIGGQKQFSYIYLGLSKENQDTVAQLRKASELSPAPSMNGLENSHGKAKISSTPLRQIFLPLDRFKKDDPICFSPFGIVRLVRGCSTNGQKVYKIVHTSLHVMSSVLDDTDLDLCRSPKSFSSFVGESIGFSFQGYLYLLSSDGLSVILPSISVSSGDLSVESIRDWQPRITVDNKSHSKTLLALDEFKELGKPWQVEVLDRTLLYEGPEEAEHICFENGTTVLYRALCSYTLPTEINNTGEFCRRHKAGMHLEWI